MPDRSHNRLDAPASSLSTSHVSGENLLVTFQGASDDLIEIEGCPGADEFTAGKGDSGLFGLYSAEGNLFVRVTYERHGCWSVAVMPSDEDAPIPPWPLRFAEPMTTYSACLEVTCPADVTLARLDERDER